MKTLSPSKIKEHPIIFSGSNIPKLLDGSKTQTRRVVTPIPAPGDWYEVARKRLYLNEHNGDGCFRVEMPCRYRVGDRLWVRETWQHFFKGETPSACCFLADAGTSRWPQASSVEYAKETWPNWKSPRYMPRWASRISLQITEVRVQRLQDISPEDAQAEGIEPERRLANWASRLVPRFSTSWDLINGKRPGCKWSNSPWVWAISFSLISSESSSSLGLKGGVKS